VGEETILFTCEVNETTGILPFALSLRKATEIVGSMGGIRRNVVMLWREANGWKVGPMGTLQGFCWIRAEEQGLVFHERTC
jgi:hypothetical protein